MKTKLIIAIFSLTIFTSLCFSQTALFFDNSTGAYGFASETPDYMLKAKEYCIEVGGRNCQLVGFENKSPGYAAIATGCNGIGFATSAPDQATANRRAIEFCAQNGCSNCKIQKQYYYNLFFCCQWIEYKPIISTEKKPNNYSYIYRWISEDECKNLNGQRINNSEYGCP